MNVAGRTEGPRNETGLAEALLCPLLDVWPR